MAKMSERELVNLVSGEIVAAMGGGDLSMERAKAMDYYLGEPFGDEQAGRSKVVISDVAEVVDNLMPSMLRIFTVPDNTVVFEPVGPEDEEQAEQESDIVNHVFWKRNNGFMVLYSWLKDGLLQKNGFIEANWVESDKVEREEYNGLNELELARLLDDPDVEPIEQVEREGVIIREVQTPQGTGQVVDTGQVFDIVIHRKTASGRITIDPIPPEEMKISSDATWTTLAECRFAGRKTTKTRSELIESFPDKKSVIMSLPTVTDDIQDTEEGRARNYLSDETNPPPAPPKLLQLVDVEIGYPRVDYDGDGVVEMRQVVVGGGKILHNEAVDRRPYHTWTPIPLPHKFFGLCPADQTLTYQRIKSVLVRQMLDSLYLANNPEKAIWDEAIGDSTMDDLLTSRVGGIKRFSRPPAEAVMPLNTEFVGAQSFPMLEWLDRSKRSRTGVGDETQGLEIEALKNIQSSVAAQALDLSRLQIEAIARVFAETGLKSLFLHIHEMLSKNSSKEMAFRINNKWVQTDPSSWRHREDMTVLVGLGAGTRESKLVHLQGIAALQEKMIQAGRDGVLVSDENIFHTAEEFVKNALFPNVERFFTNPSSPQAQQSKAAKAQQPGAMQLAQQQLSQDADENTIQAQKAKWAHEEKMRELSIREEEAITRMQKAADDFAAKLTEIEAKFNVNVPGSRI